MTLADISDVAINIAKNKFDNLGLTLDTMQIVLPNNKLPIADNSLDVVYFRLALHYFLPADTTNIFNEIYRVLKPQGRAYVCVKSPQDEKEMAFLKSTAKKLEDNVFLDSGDIKSRYGQEQWQQILRSTGFQQPIIKNYTESLANRQDVTKSGNLDFTLTEIDLQK